MVETTEDVKERRIRKVFLCDGTTITAADHDLMVMKRDGCGISGMYDRIHVISCGDIHQVFMAHNVEGYEYE